MKKSLIGTLALGLIIGAGALTVKSFADENQFTTKNSINQIESTANQSNFTQGGTEFKVLNQETNQFETLDDSNYRNSNPNYGQGCPHMDYGNFGNGNIN